MAQKRIEDYGLLGDGESCALVSRTGCIEWLCLPDFDSEACFASLLGSEENGQWSIAPQAQAFRSSRRYRSDTLILETEFETSTGRFVLIDFMPMRDEVPNVMRIVRGLAGQVVVDMRLIPRLNYGSTVPWIRLEPPRALAVAGPDAFLIVADTPLDLAAGALHSQFEVRAGESVCFTLNWYPSHRAPPEVPEPQAILQKTEQWWRAWVGKCSHHDSYREAVVRSLITLKALISQTTGGIVAAASCSLPEQLGGSRNWDYRYCWIRDATFTLYALIDTGYFQEAKAWRDWLLRAVAGNPEQIQPLYGLRGQRRLLEWEADWLAGFADSQPVRIGNAAAGQLQHDVVGEIIDALHVGHKKGMEIDCHSWEVQRHLVEYLEGVWQQPDAGIWEVRGQPRHFTHSKVMAWVAFDRAVKMLENYRVAGPLGRWKKLRGQLHDEICEQAFDKSRHTFTQSYGSQALDAATLMIPLVGFLPADDSRVRGTVMAIEQELMRDGLVYRYDAASGLDGMEGGEGALLMCSFWLADNYSLAGRHQQAQELFEHLLSLRNDVGLLAEEYDPAAACMLGNFPQAYSHVALINTARNLSQAAGSPSQDRGQEEAQTG